MPDEEAVAEPPAPAEEEQPVPAAVPAQPPEVVPEPGADEGDSVPGEKPVEEPIEDTILERLAELTAENPEFEAKIKERWKSQEPLDADEKIAQWEAEQGKSGRQGLVQSQSKALLEYLPDNVYQAVHTDAQAEQQRIQKAARTLQEEDDLDLGNLTPDNVAQHARRVASETASRTSVFLRALTQQAVRDTLEDHPVYRHLSRDQRKQIDQAWQQQAPAVAAAFTLKVALDAGLQAAPEEVKKQTRKELEKELGYAEKAKALREAMGTNGAAKLRGGAAATSTTYRTKMEARNLHVQDKLTNAEMRRINADPSIPEM